MLRANWWKTFRTFTEAAPRRCHRVVSIEQLETRCLLAASITSVFSSNNPSTPGQAVTFTALVSPQSSGPTPTGTVTFVDATTSTTLGTSTLSGGQAALTSSSLGSGIHSIVATYNGDATYDPSSGSTTQTVNKANTSASLSLSSANTVFGQAVTLTANISSSSGTTPTGTVEFVDFTNSATLGTATLNSSGVATLTINGLAPGDHIIQADYNGDANNNASLSSGQTETVSPGSTTTTLNSSASPTVSGQSVTFTAIVSPVAPSTLTPTGTVTFVDTTTGSTLSTVSLDGTGTASLTSSTLSVDTHTITATYNGSAGYATSTDSVSQTVNAASTATAVSSSANPAVAGQAVTFTATVSAVAPGSGIPTGTVVFFIDGTASAPVSLDASGQAVLTTAFSAVQSYTIVATYNGDASYTGSTSPVLTETVNRAATTTTLISSNPTAEFGQSVTFTATVSPNAPSTLTPTGTVTFVDTTTGSPLGTATLDGAGNASVSTSTLSIGTHAITATYNASPEHTTSSGSISQTVTALATTTALSSSVNPAVAGQAVTFTATVSAVSSGSGTPTGSVVFTVDGTAMPPVSLNASGQASFTTSFSVVGPNTVQAAYSGDATYAVSVSPILTETTNQGATTTTLNSSISTTVFGQSTTFTATVSPNAPSTLTPTGTVTFVDTTTGSTLGTSSLGGTGTASLTFSTLPVGPHTITATYNGSAAQTTSSGSTSQTVNVASTTTTLSSSANPAVAGQAVTFTATVSPVAPGSGTPTGSVVFTVDGTAMPPVVLVNGVASSTTSFSVVGPHTIRAAYTGDANFTVSSSSVLTETVNQGATTTTLTSSSPTAVFGQLVTFTATVSPNAPSTLTPTGTVTFVETTTGSTLGTASLNAAGIASLSSSTLPVGSHAITATYNGSAAQTTSSDSISQTVNAAATTTVLSSSANPAVAGEAVTFTATVSPVAPGGGIPTGSVVFTVDGTAASPVAINGSGQARLTRSFAVVGPHTIRAAYTGDANFTVSASSVLTETVNQGATTTTLTSSSPTAVFGQLVTFTATVSPNAPSTLTPTGTVTFVETTTGSTLGTASLNGAGIASLSSSTLPVGSHAITATYNGSAAQTTSNDSISQTVNAAATTTVLSSSVNPAVPGQAVTFTATVSAVSPGSGIPTGSVVFTVDGTASSPVAINGSGQARLTTSFAVVGPHTVRAAYTGDANFTVSASSVLTETVNQGATTTALTSSITPTAFGQSTTFTATVSPNSPSTLTPTGTVTFVDTTTGSTLGTSSLDGTGTASLNSSTLSAGTHAITATYNGSAAQTTSNDSISQTVNAAATTTALSSSANPAVAGQAVTFTATVSPVSPGSGIPTGSVVFTIDGAPRPSISLNGSGQASLTTSFAAGGPHTIAASYTPNTANFTASTSAPFTETVNPTISIANVTQAEGNAGSTTFTFHVVLSAASTVPITVDVQTTNGTATAADGDFVPLATTTLTFNPGVTSRPVTVTVTGDNTFEANEAFSVNLSRPVGAVISDGQGVGTITNDDHQPRISINDVSAREENSGIVTATFTVTLSNPSFQTITATFNAQGFPTVGTAAAGVDFQSVQGTVTFNPGQTTQTIVVPILGDTLDEVDQSFAVSLSSPTQATLAKAQGTGTIVDDDSRMFRLYNPNADLHVFTTSRGEFDLLVAQGLHDETTNAPGFTVSTVSLPGASPLHRLYNPIGGQHYLTISDVDRDHLLLNGWLAEPDQGFLFAAPAAGAAGIFHLYNINTGDHLFTADDGERRSVLAIPGSPAPWQQHNPLGFAFTSAATASTPPQQSGAQAAATSLPVFAASKVADASGSTVGVPAVAPEEASGKLQIVDVATRAEPEDSVSLIAAEDNTAATEETSFLDTVWLEFGRAPDDLVM